MANIALETIKIKLDSTGKEELAEAGTDIDAYSSVVGELVETAKVVDDSTGKETVVEAGTRTSSS